MTARTGHHANGAFELRENNVSSLVEKNGALFPDRTAVKWVSRETLRNWRSGLPMSHESITYQAFADRSARLARGLKDAGIGKGDRVMILLPMSLELYLVLGGIMRIGAIAVFLDIGSKEQLDAGAHQTEPKALIGTENVFASFPMLDAIPLKVVVEPHSGGNYVEFTNLLETEDGIPIEPVFPDEPALITYTTGSSGMPKGIVRTHDFLVAQHHALSQCIPYTEADIDLPTFPIFFLNNLACGIASVLPATNLAVPSERDVPILIGQMLSEEATCCTLAPALLSRLTEYCQQRRIELPHLRRVVTGGAPTDKEIVRRLTEVAPRAAAFVIYGSTEAEPIAFIEADELLRDTSAGNGVNVGKIVRELEYKFIKIHRGDIVLDDRGWQKWEVSKADMGELVVSGPHVCQDYYRNPVAFYRNKIKDSHGKVWHRTGDVGRLDEYNRLWIAGRVHNVILRKKMYLFPLHAEILLKTLEFVNQAAYVGIDDETLGERTCVTISLRRGFGTENLTQYLDQIRALLKMHELPADEIRILDEIPMDSRHHSKVDYGRLKKMLGA